MICWEVNLMVQNLMKIGGHLFLQTKRFISIYTFRYMVTLEFFKKGITNDVYITFWVTFLKV